MHIMHDFILKSCRKCMIWATSFKFSLVRGDQREQAASVSQSVSPRRQSARVTSNQRTISPPACRKYFKLGRQDIVIGKCVTVGRGITTAACEPGHFQPSSAWQGFTIGELEFTTSLWQVTPTDNWQWACWDNWNNSDALYILLLVLSCVLPYK